MMTYRDQLLFIASALDTDKPDLARQLNKIAIQVGHIEECLDDKVEEARIAELNLFEPNANVFRFTS